MTTAIEAQGLVELYGDTPALDGLDLRIAVFAPLAVRLSQRRAVA